MSEEEIEVIVKGYVHSFNIEFFKNMHVTRLVVYAKLKYHQGYIPFL